MLKRILGGLDILFGLLLIVKPQFAILRAFGIFSLGKGIWSMFSAAISGFFFDVFGLMDVLAGVGLLIGNNGIFGVIFTIVGIIMILKGIISMF